MLVRSIGDIPGATLLDGGELCGVPLPMSRARSVHVGVRIGHVVFVVGLQERDIGVAAGGDTVRDLVGDPPDRFLDVDGIVVGAYSAAAAST